MIKHITELEALEFVSQQEHKDEWHKDFHMWKKHLIVLANKWPQLKQFYRGAGKWLGFFDTELKLIDWLSQYSDNQEEAYVRTFLGRMLFTGEESFKKATVLSGGEKVRCMLSKTMMENPNVILFDEPTNHLDLESIQALNIGLQEFAGIIMMHSHDQEVINTIAKRIIEITPNGMIDKYMTYEEYAEDKAVQERRTDLYKK